jgi:ATP-dependent Clp protease ATP-binding subunit ClpA
MTALPANPSPPERYGDDGPTGDDHALPYADLVEPLFREFEDHVTLTAIADLVGESRQQQKGSSPQALPELTEHLATLGIELDEVRRRVEASFVPGALDHVPADAKRALERPQREAVALGDRDIVVEHLLLGLLASRSNVAVELLRHLGGNPEVVRARVLARLGKAA